jgi:ferredoxin
VFSSGKFDMASKVNTTEFEGQLFHLVRSFHVAERCTDCGDCSRVCPQGIPLMLLNRKFIKDIKEMGEEIWTPHISP